MSLAFKSLIAILLIFLWVNPAYAGEPDRWFARDKLEHFTVSALYSAGTAKIAHRHFDWGKKQSLAVGFSISISLGAAKEIADARTPRETSSVKDFIWDLAGSITGTLISGLSL